MPGEGDISPDIEKSMEEHRTSLSDRAIDSKQGWRIRLPWGRKPRSPDQDSREKVAVAEKPRQGSAPENTQQPPSVSENPTDLPTVDTALEGTKKEEAKKSPLRQKEELAIALGLSADAPIEQVLEAYKLYEETLTREKQAVAQAPSSGAVTTEKDEDLPVQTLQANEQPQPVVENPEPVQETGVKETLLTEQEEIIAWLKMKVTDRLSRIIDSMDPSKEARKTAAKDSALGRILRLEELLSVGITRKWQGREVNPDDQEEFDKDLALELKLKERLKRIIVDKKAKERIERAESILGQEMVFGPDAIITMELILGTAGVDVEFGTEIRQADKGDGESQEELVLRVDIPPYTDEQLYLSVPYTAPETKPGEIEDKNEVTTLLKVCKAWALTCRPSLMKVGSDTQIHEVTAKSLYDLLTKETMVKGSSLGYYNVNVYRKKSYTLDPLGGEYGHLIDIHSNAHDAHGYSRGRVVDYEQMLEVLGNPKRI